MSNDKPPTGEIAFFTVFHVENYAKGRFFKMELFTTDFRPSDTLQTQKNKGLKAIIFPFLSGQNRKFWTNSGQKIFPQKIKKRNFEKVPKLRYFLVEVTGFEPATPTSRM